MALTSKQRSRLKSLAHHLEPTVRVGRSRLTSALISETLRTLEAHELIKVRIDSEAGERDQLARDLASEVHAELVSVVGKIAILYRPRPEDPKIKV
jgi:RNA-binding protein